MKVKFTPPPNTRGTLIGISRNTQAALTMVVEVAAGYTACSLREFSREDATSAYICNGVGGLVGTYVFLLVSSAPSKFVLIGIPLP